MGYPKLRFGLHLRKLIDYPVLLFELEDLGCGSRNPEDLEE